MESQSLFNYTITGQNYSFYNNRSINPSVFISDQIKGNNISDVDEYIKKTCQGKPVNVSQCNGNIACIVDAAATCKEDFGLLSKKTQETVVTEKKTLGKIMKKKLLSQLSTLLNQISYLLENMIYCIC